MSPNSFTFGSVNSLDRWGMRVLEADVLLPQKRPRKLLIPGRSGSYDLGAFCYEERILRLSCDLISQTPFSRAQLREIAYVLSQKKQLTLSCEPDKYYIAELYHSPEITALAAGHVYTLNLEFTCQPFAFTAAVTVPVASGVNVFPYPGTAPSPFLLRLFNASSATAHGLTVTVTRRKS